MPRRFTVAIILLLIFSMITSFPCVPYMYNRAPDDIATDGCENHQPSRRHHPDEQNWADSAGKDYIFHRGTFLDFGEQSVRLLVME